MHQLLHLAQQCLALGVIEFDNLLGEQLVNIGIAAVGVGAALDGKRLKPGRGVAEGGAAAID